MSRALFEKTGNGVWISHLDLMRLFQRAFQRAGLTLTHTQGFNPRPSVSIALPMSVGMASHCELLDFELEMPCDCQGILERLNACLVPGVRVLAVYDTGRKLKELALLDCRLTLEYDRGIPEGTEEAVAKLFAAQTLPVEKRSKNGVTQQDIIPLLRRIDPQRKCGHTLELNARICCQNPSLNPTQLTAAISKYLPEFAPDHSTCCRMELYDRDGEIFR